MEEPEKNVRKNCLRTFKKTPENRTPQIRIKPKSFQAVSNRSMLHLSVGRSDCLCVRWLDQFPYSQFLVETLEALQDERVTQYKTVTLQISMNSWIHSFETFQI